MDIEQTILETLKVLHQQLQRLEQRHIESMTAVEGFEKSAEMERRAASQLEVQIHALRGALGEIEKLSPVKTEYNIAPTSVDATYAGGVGHFHPGNSGYVNTSDWKK